MFSVQSACFQFSSRQFICLCACYRLDSLYVLFIIYYFLQYLSLKSFQLFCDLNAVIWEGFEGWPFIQACGWMPCNCLDWSGHQLKAFRENWGGNPKVLWSYKSWQPLCCKYAFMIRLPPLVQCLWPSKHLTIYLLSFIFQSNLCISYIKSDKLPPLMIWCSLHITTLEWFTQRWCNMIWLLVAMKRLPYKGQCMQKLTAIWVWYIKIAETWNRLLLAMRGILYYVEVLHVVNDICCILTWIFLVVMLHQVSDGFSKFWDC